MSDVMRAMSGVARLLAFMQERHRIYLRRRNDEPWPWTADLILQRYRFCNVYRELDRTTLWMKQHVRDRYAAHRHLWFLVCVARHFNWPPTLERLREAGCWPNWNAKHAARTLQRWGAQAYTGAYMVNPPTKAELARLPADLRSKAAWSCLACLEPLWRRRADLSVALESVTTLWEAHQLLDGAARGWAGFTAYEVVSDLRWTRYLLKAEDIMKWAHLGPGALRGLQRVLGRPINSRPPQGAALREARALHADLRRHWRFNPPLEMREVEHSLCEFDKYERARLGEGRPRSVYPQPKEAA